MDSIKITGKRYFLKTLFPADITDEYFNWITDPEINKYLEVRFNPPSSKADLKNFVASYNNSTRYIWGIYEKEKNQYIGNMALYVNQYNKTADYGYYIGNKDYWGTSAAIEACSLMLDYAFNSLKIRKVSGGAVQHNIGSLFNFKKLGFAKEGHLRKHNLTNEGPSDVLVFGIFKDEWEDKRSKMDYL